MVVCPSVYRASPLLSRCHLRMSKCPRMRRRLSIVSVSFHSSHFMVHYYLWDITAVFMLGSWDSNQTSVSRNSHNKSTPNLRIMTTACSCVYGKGNWQYSRHSCCQANRRRCEVKTESYTTAYGISVNDVCQSNQILFADACQYKQIH